MASLIESDVSRVTSAPFRSCLLAEVSHNAHHHVHYCVAPGDTCVSAMCRGRHRVENRVGDTCDRKARHTKGEVFVCFCRLFSWLLSSYKNTRQLNLGGVRHMFFRQTALVATRFIGRYHGARQLVTSHTWDSFRQENAFLIVFCSALK